VALKSPLEEVQLLAQEYLEMVPVVILGSGASAGHGVPGMGRLSDHLKGLPSPPVWSSEERQEWTKFIAELTTGRDLETALNRVQFGDRQTTYVADATRSLLLPFDEAVLAELVADRHCLPLTRLYRYFFTSTHKTIDVITPNYDRIAEYAADAGGFNYYTGFTYGYLQTRVKETGTPVHPGLHLARTVCIWKVHGSLDWFEDPNHQIIGARTYRASPTGYMPLMITPGVEKYRRAHAEPFRTILGYSDIALDKARAYLCVGYGFNDEHVQTKLFERCDINAVPLVVIARSLTPTAKSFLGGGRCRKYVAFEEGPSGARAYTNAYPTGIDLAAAPIWQLGEFLNLTLGAEA
jgi:hypothetical protein